MERLPTSGGRWTLVFMLTHSFPSSSFLYFSLTSSVRRPLERAPIATALQNAQVDRTLTLSDANVALFSFPSLQLEVEGTLLRLLVSTDIIFTMVSRISLVNEWGR